MLQATGKTDQPIRLGFLLFPGFPMACLTSAIEPLRAANEIAGRPAFSWKLLGESSAPIPSSAEVRFTPDEVLDHSTDLDHIYLLSPPTAAFARLQRSPAVLRRLDRAGAVVGAFSGGIFPLARAGLMYGHRCSVHWCYESAFGAEFPLVEADQRVIVCDRRRMTASGAGAVFDLMLRLIDERLGPEIVTEVACWFQHPTIRGEDAQQKIPVSRASVTSDALPGPIHKAIALFDCHIEDPLRIPDVANAVNMSPRHFERMFKRETGHSPLRYYHLLRLGKARQKVLYSNAPLAEIAASVGYSRPGEMTRIYVDVFGVTPSDDRRATPANRGLSPDWIAANT